MVRGDDRFTLFVDYASIKKSGNKRLMWDLTDYKIVQIAASGGGYLSAKDLWEHDCKGKKSRIHASFMLSGHMATGHVVSANKFTSEWFSVNSGTVGETRWKKACGK